jgi:hypothetical protein
MVQAFGNTMQAVLGGSKSIAWFKPKSPPMPVTLTQNSFHWLF